MRGLTDRTHLEQTLDVLRRLNEARSIGQRDAADLLVEELDALDNAVGYKRPIRVERIPTTGARQRRGKQRNPNWRAALDKLNAMRGRTR